MTRAARIHAVLAHLPDDPSRASDLVRDEEAVREVWDHSRDFGLRPLLSHFLPDTFPPTSEETYAASFRFARMTRWTLDCVQTLARAGLECAVLKGTALGTRLYPVGWLRPSTDIDLLVRATDLQTASAALVAEGWRPNFDLPSSPFQFVHDVGFSAPGRPLLELHFTPSWHFQARFDTDALLRRAVVLELGGSAVKVLAREDDLVHLCVHAAAHVFDGVKWLFDLKLATMQQHLDWELVVRRALDARVSHVTGMALAVARERVGAPVPTMVESELAPHRAARLAARGIIRIPERFSRTRSYGFDLALADGISREWLLRLTAPLVNRAARAAGVEQLLARRSGRRSEEVR